MKPSWRESRSLRMRRGSISRVPVVVRVVLPLAAGAVLAPLPAWTAAGPAAAREAVTIRVFLNQAVVREENRIAGEIGLAGTDSEALLHKVSKAQTRGGASRPPLAAGSVPAAIGPPDGSATLPIRGGPDFRPDGHRVSNPPRAPPC